MRALTCFDLAACTFYVAQVIKGFSTRARPWPGLLLRLPAGCMPTPAWGWGFELVQQYLVAYISRCPTVPECPACPTCPHIPAIPACPGCPACPGGLPAAASPAPFPTSSGAPHWTWAAVVFFSGFVISFFGLTLFGKFGPVEVTPKIAPYALDLETSARRHNVRAGGRGVLEGPASG